MSIYFCPTTKIREPEEHLKMCKFVLCDRGEASRKGGFSPFFKTYFTHYEKVLYLQRKPPKIQAIAP